MPVSAARPNAAVTDDYQAPLLSDSYSAAPAGTLNSQQYRVVGNTCRALCEWAEPGIYVDGHRTGQTVLLCRQATCAEHWHGRATAAAAASVTPARRQELFDIKVAKAVRTRFLAETVPLWGIAQGPTQTDYFVHLLAARLYCATSYSGQKEICDLAGINRGDLTEWTSQPADLEVIGVARAMQQMAAGQLAQLLYGLLVRPFGGDENRSRAHPQTAIEEVAAELGRNYPLWDAEARVTLASKKHQAAAQAYLEAVREGKADGAQPVKPKFWQ